MRKAVSFCCGILLFCAGISAQTRFVAGATYDTIYAAIEHNGIQMRLVTTIYKDTLKYEESLRVPTYPIVRNQRMEVYCNGILKRWHSIKVPPKYAYTRKGELVKYQSIPVLGLTVQSDGDMFFFMADGSENGCGTVGEFLGIYSTSGATMFEGYGTGGVSVNVNWRKKYGYKEPEPTSEIDYSFSQRCTLKEVSLSSFFILK